jgi:hypothetical protein
MGDKSKFIEECRLDWPSILYLDYMQRAISPQEMDRGGNSMKSAPIGFRPGRSACRRLLRRSSRRL